MIDYANWLLGAPRRVYAAALTPPPDGGAVDSVSITSTYDGGHATVHYTAAGAGSMPKERIEVFRGGRSWVLDDFVSLTSFGGPGGADGASTEKLAAADKGHSQLLDGVIAATLGERPFTPGIAAAYAATAVSLAALESLSTGAAVDVATPPTRA